MGCFGLSSISKFLKTDKKGLELDISSANYIRGKISSIGTGEKFGCVDVETISNDSKYKILKDVVVGKLSAGTDSSYVCPKEGEEVLVLAQGKSAYVFKYLHSKNKLPKEDSANPIVLEWDIDDKDKISIKGKDGKRTFQGDLCNFTLCIDQEKKILCVSDSEKKNKVTIDSQNGKVSIVAEKELELEVGGKKIKFTGDTLDSGTNDLNIKANNLKINSTQNVEIGGLSVKASGTQEASLEALQVKINGSAKTSISGGMVSVG